MDVIPAELVALVLGYLDHLPDETQGSWAARNVNLARMTRVKVTEVSPGHLLSFFD